jgi:hypothetical protein
VKESLSLLVNGELDNDHRNILLPFQEKEKSGIFDKMFFFVSKLSQ